MKFKSVAVVLLLLLSSPAFAEIKFVKGVVPHYHEFDTSYNDHSPQRWYCGHATLKMVAEYVTERKTGTPEVKSMDDLHQIFIYNSPNGYANNDQCGKNDNKRWCATLLDLYYGAKQDESKWGTDLGYGRTNSRLANRDVTKYDGYGKPNYSYLLQKMKDGVNLNYPPIVQTYTSNYVGHFVTVVGYDEKSTPENSILYIRDTLYDAPNYEKYEYKMTVKDFYNRVVQGDIRNDINRSFIQFLYVK